MAPTPRSAEPCSSVERRGEQVGRRHLAPDVDRRAVVGDVHLQHVGRVVGADARAVELDPEPGARVRAVGRRRLDERGQEQRRRELVGRDRAGEDLRRGHRVGPELRRVDRARRDPGAVDRARAARRRPGWPPTRPSSRSGRRTRARTAGCRPGARSRSRWSRRSRRPRGPGWPRSAGRSSPARARPAGSRRSRAGSSCRPGSGCVCELELAVAVGGRAVGGVGEAERRGRGERGRLVRGRHRDPDVARPVDRVLLGRPRPRCPTRTGP